METKPKSEKIKDVYQLVTNRILEQLEKGIIPWRRTWTDAGLPQNLITRKPYRGLNVWLLASLGYVQNFFLTYQQLKEVGGTVKKDEKPYLVVYFKWIETGDQNGEEKFKKPFLRYFKVYNVAQCNGIKKEIIPRILKPNHPIEDCKFIVESMPNLPLIVFRNNDPYYHPEGDYINMPAIEYFDSSVAYYETLFHELVHSTGHKSRLNRKEIMEKHRFGSEQYAIEELTAEFGSCYIQSIAGIQEKLGENSAAYIQNWYAVLKKNPRLVVYAGSQAQKAVDYILDFENHRMVTDNSKG
ncbi:MAG: zincin-like metallopeptidase domain-containing protein [Bacteroidota bacterium]|nr:zincin-like metallopeptidase domain-containing protein [Bacteroidota bacterium]